MATKIQKEHLDDELVDKTTVQTLNNKTLTSPTLTTPTGDGGALTLAKVGTPTYTTIQHLQDTFHSTGSINGGGIITDAGANTIDVTAGEGFLRPTDSPVAELRFFDWAASTGLSVPSDTTRWVGVEYNAGSPQVVVRTSDDFDRNTDFALGIAVNEGGTIHTVNAAHTVGDHASAMIQRSHEAMGIQRDNVTAGIILGETGTRNITVSTGKLWDKLNKFDITALDTSVTGGFDTYSAGGKEATAATQWDNTQYDNAGTLTTLANNKFGTHWLYVTLDDEIISVYGTAQYNSAAEASTSAQPSVLPERVQHLGVLFGGIVFQKSASTAIEIRTLWMSSSPGSVTSDHGNLTGLADDDHTQYHNDARAVTWLGTRDTSDLPETTDARYMTDAQETNLDAQSGTNTGDEATASVTVEGISESATSAEVDTGTDAVRHVTPDSLQASKRNIRWLPFELVEAGTDVATATNIAGDFVSPIAGVIQQSDTTPFYLYATNSTAGTTGTMVVDISIGGTSIMTTNKLDFDTGEKTTTTAATPPDLTTTALAVGDIITIDIDAVHTTAAKGLIVYIGVLET